MWQGRGASRLQTMCRTLMCFSFQGYPGPKGEMVRPQLSCLPSRGGASAQHRLVNGATGMQSSSHHNHPHPPAVYGAAP